MQVPWARILQDNRGSIADNIARRQDNNRRPNYGGSWHRRQDYDAAMVSRSQLEIVQGIRDDYKGTIRIRIEEPWVQFYAKNEDDLKVITSRFDQTCKDRILSVSLPKSDEHVALLNSGDIILKKDNGFNYKVMIRDGAYPYETKQQLLNYIISLGDDVQISEGSQRQLASTMHYTWGVFFYIKDPKLVTFMSLIHPQLIRKIHKLVVID